ncbi:unnamed protein product, partial [Discosporangium mesarthrocarpum]
MMQRILSSKNSAKGINDHILECLSRCNTTKEEAIFYDDMRRAVLNCKLINEDHRQRLSDLYGTDNEAMWVSRNTILRDLHNADERAIRLEDENNDLKAKMEKVNGAINPASEGDLESLKRDLAVSSFLNNMWEAKVQALQEELKSARQRDPQVAPGGHSPSVSDINTTTPARKPGGAMLQRLEGAKVALAEMREDITVARSMARSGWGAAATLKMELVSTKKEMESMKKIQAELTLDLELCRGDVSRLQASNEELESKLDITRTLFATDSDFSHSSQVEETSPEDTVSVPSLEEDAKSVKQTVSPKEMSVTETWLANWRQDLRDARIEAQAGWDHANELVVEVAAAKAEVHSFKREVDFYKNDAVQTRKELILVKSELDGAIRSSREQARAEEKQRKDATGVAALKEELAEARRYAAEGWDQATAAAEEASSAKTEAQKLQQDVAAARNQAAKAQDKVRALEREVSALKALAPSGTHTD